VCAVFAVLTAGAHARGGAGQADAVEFELQDSGGKLHHMDDYADSRVVVLAFLGTDCPLVHRYSVRLQQISREFSARGVVVLGVNSNRQDSIAEIASFARRTAIEFPILRDTGNVLADRVGAERTPEVVVLDDRRTVKYRGRIDDQFGVGYSRPEAEAHYLRDAIEAVLKGMDPEVSVVPAEGCLIGRLRQPDADATVTYGGQIAEIVNQHCVSCHREGEIGPFTLTSYEDVAGWADMIREVVRDRRMPPWHADPSVGHFANARGLSEEEKQLIHEWVVAGAPAGDLELVPPLPRKETREWHLGREPDEIITMGRRFDVPADGVVDYKYFVVDPGFVEDRWLKAAEIIPGSREIVHHVLVFARPEGSRRGDPGAGGGSFLAAYVPGLIQAPYPDGMAKMIPAGSRLVFQMHYTPNGVAQSDETKIGLYFADESEVDEVVMTQEARNRRFRILPHAANQKVTSRSVKSTVPVKLLGMMPHMHVRGQSFEYFAVHKDGARNPLLKVPEYDFNWQTSYRLAEPMVIPPDTYLECVAHFDNSEANLNNPDPTETVRWGDQTTEEMMIGYFDIAVPRSAMSSGRIRSPAVDRLLGEYDQDGDGMLQRREVPSRLHGIFDRLDKDKNQELTVQELSALAGR